MNLSIRHARLSDYDTCYRFDQFNKRSVLEQKIEAQLVLLAIVDDACVGYLRWDWFWNRIPYLCLIKVEEIQRGKGIGFGLLSHWERELVEQGFAYCLSSSQENEPLAVEWHKRQGYNEIGRLASLNPDGSAEIFMRRELDPNA